MDTDQQSPPPQLRSTRGPAWLAPSGRRLDRTDAVWMLVIATVALAIHLVRLGAPGALLTSDAESCRLLPPLDGQQCYAMIPLDEVHYVPDARDVLRYGTASDLRVPDGEGQSGRFVVHPPVGRWFIAAGIWLFGDRPFGWRFFGATFGALSSVLMYLIARRLWAPRWAAILAGGLLAVEGLWFVLSRVAMLDIYAASLLLLAFWMLIEDRDRAGPQTRGFRPWLLGAGVVLGLAIGAKWSVAPLAGMAIGMALAWEVVRIWPNRPRRIVTSVGGFTYALVLVPTVVYLATFTPWMINDQRYSPGDCPERSNVISELWCYHGQMVGFHRNLEKFEEVQPTEAQLEADPEATATIEPRHPYFGEAWSWPWIGRPVAHHFETLGEAPEARASEVLGLPNPSIWWPAFMIAIPALIFWTFARGDPNASLLLGMIVAGWGPYLFADVIDRPVFLFYATPLIPFLILGLTHLLVRLAGTWSGSVWLIGGYGLLTVVMFVYFYPVIAAHPIPREGWLGWNNHMWFSGEWSDCTATMIKIRCWI